MADSTISQLPVALSVSASDVIPIDQGGVTKRTTLGQLGTGTVFTAPGKTLTINNTLTFQGTDGTTITFPATDATVARTDAGQTFTGTQVFGVITCTTINGGTLSFVAAKTLTVNNTITFTGTDGVTITLPATSATMARTDAAQTFTGVQTFSSTIVGNIDSANVATALQTARNIDGVSFNGTADILVVAPATHAAPNKATPVDADEFSIWDSVSGLLNHVTWANIKTVLGSTFAALAGSASQVFSVALGTSAAHAARVDQVSLYPTVTSAASPDIFGAAGATISINNSTPVTMTDITDCTAAQVGSVKRVIPVQAWTVTASANMTVDGKTSGDTPYPANAELEIRAKTTSTFAIRTVLAQGTWTPSQGTGLTVVGAFSSSGSYSKQGDRTDYIGQVNGATSVAVGAGLEITGNAPMNSKGGSNTSLGNAMDANAVQTSVTYMTPGTNNISATTAIAASSTIYISGRIFE